MKMQLQQQTSKSEIEMKAAAFEEVLYPVFGIREPKEGENRRRCQEATHQKHALEPKQRFSASLRGHSRTSRYTLSRRSEKEARNREQTRNHRRVVCYRSVKRSAHALVPCAHARTYKSGKRGALLGGRRTILRPMLPSHRTVCPMGFAASFYFFWPSSSFRAFPASMFTFQNFSSSPSRKLCFYFVLFHLGELDEGAPSTAPLVLDRVVCSSR